MDSSVGVSVARFVAARVGQAVLVTWVAYTAAFFLLYALPSDPVSLLLGPDAVDVSAAERAELAARYGFDLPIFQQYLNALGGLLRGDLGFSVQMGGAVGGILAGALGPTAILGALGLLLAIVIGVGIAIAATYSTTPLIRQFLLGLPSLAVSIPAFWLGLILIQVFSFRLQWFPAFSAEGLSGLILPALTLALPTSAMIAQVFTRSLSTSFHEAYADTAFAKGAPRSTVLIHHAARNALLPALTITGLVVGQLLSGTVVTETVFSRPGLGRVIATAVSNQDIPVVLGAVLVGAVLYSGTNLIVDLLYPVFDPRQRERIGARKVSGSTFDSVVRTGTSPDRAGADSTHDQQGDDRKDETSDSTSEYFV
ncbi:ABC transporter permease [Corynebacterium pacaense]|uniref:ABC transporter permease n=1 Tax=Corynebacterium pacaense TaxID=1816684 RepID=UPI0009BAF1BA|nr:ABC transporter permease [Corynebacterium pacaense]